MKMEAQRIAIAQARGWTLEKSNEEDGVCWHWEGIQSEVSPPNYPDDLNAACEAIQSLAREGWKCVCNMGLDGTWECVLTQDGIPSLTPGEGDHYGAGKTLAQAMCEAFLQKIGKWE